MSNRSGQVAMEHNGGDWRSKSPAMMPMVSTTFDGFYFANCVLAAAADFKAQCSKYKQFKKQ